MFGDSGVAGPRYLGIDVRKPRPIVIRNAPDPQTLSDLTTLDPVHARLYAMRGVTRPDQLDYGLGGLAPVSSLEHISDAVQLLLKHRDRRIIIVGDFDVDGATSTALLMRCCNGYRLPDVVQHPFDLREGGIGGVQQQFISTRIFHGLLHPRNLRPHLV